MRVTRLSLRDFRSYGAADVHLGEAITVVHGRNGAGKTNLLEALYIGCTGRSWRTSNDRDLVRFGATVGRVELTAEAEDGPHVLEVGLEPGERRRMRVDGVGVERLTDVATRPLAAVFVPDRLDLIKGGPAARRGHIDQVVAALWPARVEARRAYMRAIGQRNALLARGPATAAASLDAWDETLARHGAALIAHRREAVASLAPSFAALASQLGLDGEAALAYRPRTDVTTAEDLAVVLRERRGRDLERGFTAQGPHRDDLALTREGRDLRSFGSQGQQRLAVLALLLAERTAIAGVRGFAPVMLLDDALSELDAGRRERLLCLLRSGSGQSVISTTDVTQVPATVGGPTVRLAVAEGAALAEAAAA